jgi:hypothetical protein
LAENNYKWESYVLFKDMITQTTKFAPKQNSKHLEITQLLQLTCLKCSTDYTCK